MKYPLACPPGYAPDVAKPPRDGLGLPPLPEPYKQTVDAQGIFADEHKPKLLGTNTMLTMQILITIVVVVIGIAALYLAALPTPMTIVAALGQVALVTMLWLAIGVVFSERQSLDCPNVC